MYFCFASSITKVFPVRAPAIVVIVALELLLLSGDAIVGTRVAEGEGKQMKARVAKGFRQTKSLSAKGIVGDSISKVVPNNYFSKWINV